MMSLQHNIEDLKDFSDFIREWNGMDFDKTNAYILRVALRERMHALNIKDYPSYLDRIKLDLEERLDLTTLLSVPETYFFRDRRQFEALRDKILPEMIDRKRQQGIASPSIRILSAGCSIGAEPYSIAVAVDQSGLRSKAQIEIVAFDINKQSLEIASQGIYNKHAFREPETDFLNAYFDKKGSNFALKDTIKRMVNFYSVNLFDSMSFDKKFCEFDVVFLRNVLIYFSEEGIQKILHVFEKRMNPEGYLFLGFSESLLRRKTGFKMVEFGKAFAWKLNGAQEFRKDPVVRNKLTHKEYRFCNFEKLQESKARIASKESLAQRKTKESIEHYQNALGYMKLKHLEKAEEEFQAQLNKNPKHVPSLVGLATIYSDQELDSKARETSMEALKINNLAVEPYMILGALDLKNHNYVSAENCFKKVIYCDAQHFVGHFYLGLVYKEQRKPKAANREFIAAMESIEALGEEGLTREVSGYSANYILNLCVDSYMDEGGKNGKE